MAYINGKQVLFSARVNGLVNVDNELSGVSTNPVENQAVANAVGNAFKGKLSGAAVRADGVSPIEHSPVVKVAGKNIFDISKISVQTEETKAYVSAVTENSITISEPDGYSINGYCGINLTLKDLCPNIKEGHTYTLSAETDSTRRSMFLTKPYNGWDFGKSRVITAEDITSPIVFYGIDVTAGGSAGDCVISNIQIELGDTASEYTPHIDPASVTLTRCGKNLLNPIGENATKNGVTFTNNGDGTFTVKGTSTGPAGFDLTNLTKSPLHLSKGETYTQSVVLVSGSLGGATIVPSVKDSDGNVKYNYFSNNTTKTADNDYSFYTYTLYIDKAETIDATFKVQLEIGSTTTDYEAYTAETYTPNADGTVEGVTSLSPCMSFITDTAGANIEVEYNKDSNAVIGDVEAAADAIIAIQESLIGGASV